MTTRDRTGEILEVKERNPSRHRFGSFSLESLKSQWTKNGKSEGATPDFYVISRNLSGGIHESKHCGAY
jgi:hypothetical protein